MNLTIGSHTFHLSVVALIGVGAFTFYVLGQRDGRASDRPVPSIDSVHAAIVRRDKTLEAWITSARKTNAELAEQLLIDEDSLKHAGERLTADSLPIDTGAVHAFVHQCMVTVSRCEEQAATWKAVADSETARANLADDGRAAADSALKVALRPTRCLLWACPSRTTVAAFSFLLGFFARH